MTESNTNTNCNHVWQGSGLWDGKTPDGKPTGGILYICAKCGLQTTTQEKISELGGTIDWDGSRMKPAGWDQ